MRKYSIFSVCLLLISACERTSLAPVELKIDDSMRGYATGSSIANTYTVQRGETLFDVANKFSIDPRNLAKLNNIGAPYGVKSGQVLKLPPENPEALDNSSASYESVKIEDQNDGKLDDKFAQMMREDKSFSQSSAENSAVSKNISTKSMTSAKASTSSVSSKKGNAKEAEELLSPKITKTASGTDLKDKKAEKKKDEKKEAKKAEVPISEEKKAEGKASNSMNWPVKGKVTAKFGSIQDGVPNDGIDIKASSGDTVKAVDKGEVIYAGSDLDPSFGNVVVVKHDSGLVSIYAYLGSIAVKQGMKLQSGQKVGLIGKSPLHLEIMRNNTPEDPEKHLKRGN